jgi:predicted nucleic acid-binding protein
MKTFTDCTSFVLAQQTGMDEVFGFDQHFFMFGFNVKPLW